MSPSATACRHPMPRAGRLGLDHGSLLPNLLVDSSPSRRHDLAPASLQLDHGQGSLLTPNERHDNDTQSLPTRKRARLPDWDEFYKNGMPREIIVIEDTPEPPRDVHNAATPEASLPAAQPSLPASKKRKRGEVSTAKAAAAAPDGELGRPGLEPKARDLLDGTKKRRTRLQWEIESSREHRLSGGTVAEYRGLSGPVVRSKDVFVRLEHAVLDNDKRKLADDDGHFIVVPDISLASRYQIKKHLGQGTFGKVVQAFDYGSSELVAVKIIRSVQKYRDAAKIELRVLQTLRQNDAENRYRCIHLRDCFDFYGHTCIVMDLLDSSLFDFLKANSFVPFPNSHIQSIAKQLLTSIAFLHDLGLIHTDLKPENILLRDASYQTFTYNRTVPSSRTTTSRQAPQRRVLLNPEIRLIDFGSATFQDEYHSSVVSTRHYRAPEIIMGLGWTFPCDIWSIGCILVELFTGDALFQTHDNLEHLAMMEAVFDTRIDINMIRQVNRMTTKGSVAASSFFKRLRLNYPTAQTCRASRRFVKSMKRLEEIIPQGTSFLVNFLDLVRKMLVYDPSRRITAKQALLHPWFKEHLRDDGTEAARIAMSQAPLER